MQNTEENGHAAEERRDKGDKHTEEEALRAAFYIVLWEAADGAGDEDKQPRKDIADYVEPAVEENRHVHAEDILEVVHRVIYNHTDYRKSAQLVKQTYALWVIFQSTHKILTLCKIIYTLYCNTFFKKKQ